MRYFCIVTAIVAFTDDEPMSLPPAPEVEFRDVVEFESAADELESCLLARVVLDVSKVQVEYQ